MPSPSHLQQTTHVNHALFVSSSQTFPPFPLSLPKFHVHTVSAHQASRHTANYACTQQADWSHLPSYGRQVPPTPTFRLVGAHNNWLPWGFLKLDASYGACHYLHPNRTVAVTRSLALPQFQEMWWKDSSGRLERHILKDQIRLPNWIENNATFSSTMWSHHSQLPVIMICFPCVGLISRLSAGEKSNQWRQKCLWLW